MTQMIQKPWGKEIVFANNEKYIGKVLVIQKGESLSLQYHEKKDETIYVAKGKLELLIDDEKKVLTSGQSYRIFPKTKHRMRAMEDCEVFEVSTPHFHDVVRLEDRYGRVPV